MSANVLTFFFLAVKTYSISFTELLESKTSLAEKAKIALDSTVESYKDFINDIPKSLL